MERKVWIWGDSSMCINLGCARHGGTPLIPPLGRQRQVDVCELKASLVYIVSSMAASTTQ